MDARGGPHVGALHPPCVMSAFDCIHNDVLVEVLAFLDVESVLQVGGTCPSLRKATLLDRVWTPRLATAGLGRSALDANALTELARFSACPRRLCLQALPWRPRCGADPMGKALRMQSAFSWRPLPMPTSLRQPSAAGNWIFVEVYEVVDRERSDIDVSQLTRLSLDECPPCAPHCIHHCIAKKFVSLDVCSVEFGSGALRQRIEVTVPLGFDFATVRKDCLEVRMFMQLDGMLLPVADSSCMDGSDTERAQRSDWDNLRFDLFSRLHLDESTTPTRLANVNFDLGVNIRKSDGPYVDYVTYPLKLVIKKETSLDWLVDYHNSHAMRIISTIEDDGVLEGYNYTFACDYARDSADQFDFTMNERQARLDAEKRQARLDAEREVRANEEKVRSLRHQLEAAQRDLDASERKLDALPRS